MATIPEKYFAWIEKYLPLTVFFTIPFNYHISIYFVWAFVLFAMLYIRKMEVDKFHWYYFTPLVFYFLFLMIGFFYSENTSNALNIIILKLLLFLFPVALLFFSDKLKKYIFLYFGTFIFSCFLVSVILILIAVLRSFSFIDGELLFRANVLDGETFWSSIARGGNYFFYTQLSRMMHPSYIALCFLTAIIFLVFNYKNRKRLQSKSELFYTKKSILIALVSYFSIFIILLSSRANFIALLALAFYFFTISKIKYKLLIISILTIFGISALFLFPRFHQIIDSFSSQKQNSYVVNSRLLLWKTSIDVFNQNPILGVGTGDVEAELHEKIISYELKSTFNEKYNSHNFILQELVRLGIIGSFFFFAFWVFLVFYAIKRKNNLLVSFLIVVLINCFFESMFERIDGILIIGFLLNFCIFTGLSSGRKNK